MKVSRFAGLLGLVMVSACASGGSGRTPEYWVKFRSDAHTSRHVVPFPPEQVVLVLPRAYESLGLPGGAPRGGNGMEFMTPQLGVRGQLYGKRNSEFIDCGMVHNGSAIEDQGEVQLAMITRLEPVAGGTAVITQVDSYARRRDTSSEPIYCPSRGVLEDAVAEILLMHLRGTPPPPRG
jgi:hypothetical protein